MHPQTIAQPGVANRGDGRAETAQDAGLALDGMACVNHLDIEADLCKLFCEECTQRSETAAMARHATAGLDNLPGQIIGNQPMRAGDAFQQVPKVRVRALSAPLSYKDRESSSASTRRCTTISSLFMFPLLFGCCWRPMR